MERTKFKIILLFLMFYTSSLIAGNRDRIYLAYISGNMQEWKRVTDLLASTDPSDPQTMAELVNYQYGYIGWCIGTGRNDEAKKYLSHAENNLEKLEKITEYRSLVLSYRSAFYGYRIGLNKLLSPVLGIKSYESARQAITLDENNPMGYIQYGNIMFYVPKTLGGSKAEALKYYLKALELIEKDTASLSGDWNYLNLLTLIARTCTYINDYGRAKQYLDKILETEPDFRWARDELSKEIIEKNKK